ncbi:LuxR C-terminal-related transcriptional regulator [Hyunsoonleella aestuarii]|uniref:HTH luxR-type domain-containing protein n=1 Tax=Hyunsoonleella aestuarii TaxID=912802 RepID=A0ABP8E8L1_9FLAO|nr:LuxR C-terminal-related transcriptional regulator [Hyunsoonleella aestuarii]
MNDKDYFSYLYEIASHLNKEFSLHSALRMSLEKTVEILDLETGWFWLTEPDNKSVYLAASYNLPPALSKHPERLSGWCYCIKQYLRDDIDQAMNISEITCSRLQDIITGTKGLKFHAVIPITIKGQKVGLMNLLSKETRQLNEKELAILNTISQLVGTAIQRTRLKQSYKNHGLKSNSSLSNIIERVINPHIKDIISNLESSKGYKINEALNKTKELQKQLSLLSEESLEQERAETNTEEALLYPELPLTKRELEVLSLIKKGLTNNQIGNQLFIVERTVKFHVTSILSKLHANTRTEAVDIALKRGFLSI